MVAADANPYSGRTQYGLRSLPIVVAALAVGVVWWARRTGRTWDADLLPALFGGMGSLTLLIALHGTPFDTLGLTGDATFRQEAITRFADTWHLDDYTYKGLPAYYAPAFFWVSGRVAAVAGITPWHMLKLGTIAVAFVAPVLSYLLWRRIVSARTAAIISATALLIPWLDEAYAAIIVVTFVPWWLEVGFGLTRRGVKRLHPVTLGLIGAAFFLCYYYFFFIIPFVLVLQFFVARRGGWHSWRETGRTAVILGIAAAGSAVFWAPLAWSMLTAPNVESLNNRWIVLETTGLALPFFEPSVFGALCLIGLAFLVVTAKEALSRALLILLVSLYVWQVVGFLLLAVEKPLMSFRMRELVPVVLLAAAAIAGARLTKYATEHLSLDLAGRLAAAAGVLLVVFAGDRFVGTVLDRVKVAHNQTLPDGTLPQYHRDDAQASSTPSGPISAAIDGMYQGEGHPVVLTDRLELMAIKPYYGFVQFNVNYSHPSSQFHPRIAFLRELAAAATPAQFAALTDNNPYDKIDALALGSKDKDDLVFSYSEDAFPFGNEITEITIPKKLIQANYFDIKQVGPDLVAVRRPGT
ncbi:arabinofuranosyltransferase AftA [Paractinoplanes toevensis]|uniref:Galactan 5-O-arabinofuranosyltransferase n=1 Tax=Paractinoplanes toevensis TaxID=571911 RepID=A0A919T3F5_9ACTN|nr:arabinofuranosyltransferase AftA [Actinoplanes toevensis]